MTRELQSEVIEGEIGIVVNYTPGRSAAKDVLNAALNLIDSIDKLDKVLLSNIDTSLHPVSILNDVQHSSLKLLLARALKAIPDQYLKDLEWKKIIGELLVFGKYKLLQKINDEPLAIQEALSELADEYAKIPGDFVGHEPPSVNTVTAVLDEIRDSMSNFQDDVTFQTIHGDVTLSPSMALTNNIDLNEVFRTTTNTGKEYFKVKQTDMLGESKWSLVRNNKLIKASILNKKWLEKYHRREAPILPGDSLYCVYEETIKYNNEMNEIGRELFILEVLDIISPPSQEPFSY